MSKRVYEATWSVERKTRLAHLETLPGKAHLERLETLNHASRLFSSNLNELMNLISGFVGTDRHVNDLPETFEYELIRLFHNYLASVATLRDMQRATHRSVWTERLPESDRHGKSDKRTKWEASVYQPKVKEVFHDESMAFLSDLRNCALHRTVPLMKISSTLSLKSPGTSLWINKILLNRAELEKYNNWSKPAKRFLDTQDGDVDFLPTLKKHAAQSRQFFEWFWREVKMEIQSEGDEYLGKSNELRLWLREVLAKPDFEENSEATPIPGSFVRNRARARAERAIFGTKGWRQIAVDRAGNTEVGATDWGPLPDPRR